MDLDKERVKLVELIKIPVGEIKHSTYFTELCLDKFSIGFLPTSLDEGSILWNTEKQFLQKLDWARVYGHQKSIIDEKIRELIPVAQFKALPISFRRLFIEDENGNLIASFECVFRSGHWSILDEHLIHSDRIPQKFPRPTQQTGNGV
jgi:hypothetical protein